MSRFFPLENIANDASRGLDFNFGGGCMLTSVTASLSDLVKLLSEREDRILLGVATPSGLESSTTHCQDSNSDVGRGGCSSTGVPMTKLASGRQ